MPRVGDSKVGTCKEPGKSDGFPINENILQNRLHFANSYMILQIHLILQNVPELAKLTIKALLFF